MRRLLLFGAGALLLVFAGVVAASVIETNQIASHLEEIRSRLRPRAEAAYEIEINLFEVSSAVLSLGAAPDTATARVFQDERRQLDGAVAAYLALSRADRADSALAQKLRTAMARHGSLADRLVSLRPAPRVQVTPAYRDAQADYAAVRAELARLLDTEIQPSAISEWHAEADRVLVVSRRQSSVILLVAVLGISIAVLAGILTARAHAGVDRARADAELSSQQKSEFASITAHELRSPLTAILGSLRIMASGRAGQLPATASPYVDMASRNCARVMELINELLELDRMEAGMLPFALATVNVSETVHSACAALDPMAEELRVTIRAEYAGTRPITGDRDRLRQVLINLMSNALKHAPPDTDVVVRVEDRGSRVRISVRDHGPGINAKDRERIFQRFVQTGSASQHASTGLGLTIAREIVHRHHGEIGVDSELGQGATFWFDIPAPNPTRSDREA